MGCEPLLKAVRGEVKAFDQESFETLKGDMYFTQIARPAYYETDPTPAIAAKMQRHELDAWGSNTKTRQIFVLLSNELKKNFTKLCTRVIK